MSGIAHAWPTPADPRPDHDPAPSHRTTRDSDVLRVGMSFTLDESEYDGPSGRLYGFVLEVCEEAEHLGLDTVWFSEHHCWGHGHLAQPLVLCAAAAARTSRIRIGTAVTIATVRHPVHLAEEAAVVDLVSGGRLELGVGAGYHVAEFSLFGADVTTRYDVLDQRVREVRAHFAGGRLLPAPVQSPVPIWLGYQGPKGAYRAGLLGEGLLSADAGLWPAYRRGLEDGGHRVAAARMSGAVSGWITDDPDRDWPVVSPVVARRFDGYRRRYVEGRDLPLPAPVDPSRLRQRTPGGRPLGSFLHATPGEAAARIAVLTGDAPVEEVHIDMLVGGLREEEVVRQVRAVATDLAPLLRTRRRAGDPGDGNGS
jgi:alkanesulfonate monooxygenase SsuD/methylene tetrahydromethanopterin reductase-like flavin-dependent oxidoreductase (luciferase family)